MDARAGSERSGTERSGTERAGIERAGIENALYRYAWTYDLDKQGIDECFTLDAEVSFADTGLISGRAAVAAEMARRRSSYPPGVTPWHVISNIYIARQTDLEADVKSFYTFIVVKPGEPLTVRSVGYYDDIFRYDDGGWRIWRRSIVAVGASPGPTRA
jgi:hypothetical protein